MNTDYEGRKGSRQLTDITGANNAVMFMTMNVDHGMRRGRAELAGITGANYALVFTTMNVDHEKREGRAELAGITSVDSVTVGREGKKQLFKHRRLELTVQDFLLNIVQVEVKVSRGVEQEESHNMG